MQGFYEENIEQLAFYQKVATGKKTRNQKKKQKQQRLVHDINDPDMKKERHKLRQQKDKKSFLKKIQGLTYQQSKKYLLQKKQAKKQLKERLFLALETGQQIYIDIVYQTKMCDKQNKSLANQIQLILKSTKKHLRDNLPGIHLCSVGGVVLSQLQKMCYHYWPLGSHKENIVEVANIYNKKLVYLSPDAELPLEQVDSDTAYVIGGLVDRTVLKNASLDRARSLGIQARNLPIRQMMINRSCLNVDHVVMILMKFKQCQNWKQAFQFGAPKRWKKDINTKQNQNNSHNSDQQQQELQQFQQIYDNKHQ